jgi:hypothetical protein
MIYGAKICQAKAFAAYKHLPCTNICLAQTFAAHSNTFLGLRKRYNRPNVHLPATFTGAIKVISLKK